MKIFETSCRWCNPVLLLSQSKFSPSRPGKMQSTRECEFHCTKCRHFRWISGAMRDATQENSKLTLTIWSCLICTQSTTHKCFCILSPLECSHHSKQMNLCPRAQAENTTAGKPRKWVGSCRNVMVGQAQWWGPWQKLTLWNVACLHNFFLSLALRFWNQYCTCLTDKRSREAS